MNSLKFSAKVELLRIIRRNLYVLYPIIFIFFGILSPLMARYLNDMIASSPEMSGIVLELPEPVPADALAMFNSNIFQMGSIAAASLVITALGFMTKPGSVIFYRTRNHNIFTVIIPRVIVDWCVIVLSLGLGTITMYALTDYLLGPLPLSDVLRSMAEQVLFMSFIISIALLTLACTRKTVTTLVITVAVVFLLPIINQIPHAPEWIPTQIVNSSIEHTGMLYLVTLLSTCILLAASAYLFRPIRLTRD